MLQFPHLHSFFGYIGYLKNLSYPQLYLIVIASGHLIPIPEPVTLIILGYLAGVGRHNIFGLIAVSALAVMTFDLVIYFIGKSGSRLARYLETKIKTHILEKYKDASNFDLAILFIISHFVPGWRIANPVIAGVTDISFKKFFLLTFVSAIVYTPAYLLIGYFFRSKILLLINVFQSAQKMTVPIVLLIMLLLFLVYLSFEKKKKVYNSSIDSL